MILISAATVLPDSCHTRELVHRQEGGREGTEGRSWQEGKPVCCDAAQLCVNGKACWRLPALVFAQELVGGREGRKKKENAAIKRIASCPS